MRRTINMLGRRVGRLVVLERAQHLPNHAYWRCLCNCGAETIVRGSRLKSGETRSCGCLNSDITRDRLTTHNKSRTPTYHVWHSIKSRCLNPNDQGYSRYGGRGIAICDRWRDSFEAFFDDMGEQPPGLSIDRRDNNLGYSPGNCRWATNRTQSNNMRTNRFLEFRDQRKTVAQWSRAMGLTKNTLKSRLRSGWSNERALTTKARSDRVLKFKGRKQTIAQWSHEIGIGRYAIYSRLERGWSVERALTEPVHRSR